MSFCLLIFRTYGYVIDRTNGEIYLKMYRVVVVVTALLIYATRCVDSYIGPIIKDVMNQGECIIKNKIFQIFGQN